MMYWTFIVQDATLKPNSHSHYFGAGTELFRPKIFLVFYRLISAVVGKII